MARYWELVGTPGLADTILPAMEAALAEHEKTSLAGKPSERGRKVMADAKKYNEMTAPQLRKAEARIARMNRDPNVKRLDQQIDRTERDLHDVASKHGLESGGFVNRDLACRTNSSAAQRVCALSKRLAQLTDKRIAFEKRYGVRD
jgi:hypothetical protein